MEGWNIPSLDGFVWAISSVG